MSLDITPHADSAEASTTAAVETALRRVAPLWPLERFVAVNPFLGLDSLSLAEAAEAMGRAAGARVTPGRALHRDALAAGRITEADLAAALAAAHGAPGLPADTAALRAAAETDPPAPAPVPTVADLAGRASGTDWAGIAAERIAHWAAAHFDRGQAPWAAPDRDRPAYGAWHAAATRDRTPEIMGLAGFRAAVAALPRDAGALIVQAVGRLGLPEAARAPFFHRLLMTVPGWVGHARFRLWEAELSGGTDDSLRDLLAVRLAWELLLFERFEGTIAAAWQDAVAAHAAPATPAPERVVDAVLQDALERAAARDLADRLPGRTAAAAPARPDAQAVFCIDVRSEVFRRALEGAAPGVETMGFAGFFGVAMEHVGFGEESGMPACPVLLSPGVTIPETLPEGGEDAAGLRRLRLSVFRAWKQFKMAAVSSFAFVETMGPGYVWKLLTDATGSRRPVPDPRSAGIDAATRARLAPRITPGRLGGRETGMALETRIASAAAILRAMSLTDGFGRIVALVGHGSTTVNNPHAAGLDCGACGGLKGGANARVAVMLLNDPEVRAGLAGQGIAVPDDTVFLACEHDTTTDAVTVFDRDAVPASHARDLAALERDFAAAGRACRAERAGRLALDPSRAPEPQVLARAADWAETRPEWGLAGCAAFIAAPRARTAGADLGGRAFLHSYDWRADEGFGTLELIMTAPMVVASWISLQYYGSSVDNAVFGSGNKVLHNVAAGLGVQEGTAGDLRPGLPWQSVHDGETPQHEPLRLMVAIEAPVEAMTTVIARHDGVRRLLDNGWITLFAMDGEGRLAARYAGGLAWTGMPGAAPAAA